MGKRTIASEPGMLSFFSSSLAITQVRDSQRGDVKTYIARDLTAFFHHDFYFILRSNFNTAYVGFLSLSSRTGRVGKTMKVSNHIGYMADFST